MSLGEAVREIFIETLTIDGKELGFADDVLSFNADPFAFDWSLVAAGSYTATPTDTDTLAMSDTGKMKVGLPIKYKISTTFYYGVIAAVVEDTSIDILGAPMGDDLVSLHVGPAQRVVPVKYSVFGTYGDDVVATLLATDMGYYERWDQAAASLVHFACNQRIADTGVEAKINVNVNGAPVSTNDGNNGVQLGAVGTWVENPAVAINTANYDIQWREAVEINCTVAGGNGDAENLSVGCVFVLQ